MTTYIGLVDVGFLKAEGARMLGTRRGQVRPDAEAVIDWFKGLDRSIVDGASFVRTYWHDGAFDPAHPEYPGQRAYFDAIGFTPGVQLHLGHVAERTSRLEKPVPNALRNAAAGVEVDADKLLAEFARHWSFRPERQQKGVDTLIALDLVRLAGRAAFDTAILIAGDRDLAEAVRATQDFGRRVVVATPSRRSVARSSRNWPTRSSISTRPTSGRCCRRAERRRSDAGWCRWGERRGGLGNSGVWST